MNNYIISSDSTCDMPSEFYLENDIVLAGLSFTMENKHYHCGIKNDMPLSVFYEKIAAGIPATTNQANVAEHLQHFEKAAKEGKDVLHISFSSALSGTHQSAVLAAQEAAENYPDRKFLVIDSLCASHGEGLFLYQAIENKKAGMSLEENFQWLIDNRLHFCHWFTVNDLEHLHRGGRVSKTAAIMGTMLGIKPVLHMDDEGKLMPVEKVRGRTKAVDALLSHMKATVENPDGQMIFIGHTEAQEEADRLKAMVKAEYPMVKGVEIIPLGPVIASHTGMGVVSLFFFGKVR